MERASTHIQLCGRLAIEFDGRHVEELLSGRQARLLFGYLVVGRRRPVTREVLMELLWPGHTPDAADASLRPLLSRLRQVLGDRLAGRSELRVALPPDAWVDVEVAARCLHHAESSLSLGRWKQAWLPAQIGWSITAREFLVGCEGEWVEEQRSSLREDHLRALQCIATAGIHLGEPELPDAERAARSLIELAPYRESGYRLLMEALAARGEIAEALRVHDRLRCLLREELGITPGKEVQTVFERLLGSS